MSRFTIACPARDCDRDLSGASTSAKIRAGEHLALHAQFGHPRRDGQPWPSYLRTKETA